MTIDKDYKKIKQMKIFCLSTFGHNGVDRMHSLLDGHKEILIMPAFSYFRSINRLKLRNEKFSNLRKINLNEISKEITKIFYEEKMYQTQRRKFLFNSRQKNLFQKHLSNFLLFSSKLEKNFEVSFFYSIHYAFSKIQRINLKKKKIIIVQEHVPWHSYKYLKIFKAKFIFMMRDPRAALAGTYVRFRKHFKKQMNPLQFDYSLFYWSFSINFHNFLLRNGIIKCIKIVKYEDMIDSLELTQKKLCKFLKIKFYPSLLKTTFLNKKWFGESSYLQTNQEKDLKKSPSKDYFNKENAEKRWRNELSKKEIVMIEIFLRNIFHKYNYKLDNQFSIYYFLTAYYYLFSNYLFENFNLFKLFKNFLRRFFVIFFPKNVTKLFSSFR